MTAHDCRLALVESARRPRKPRLAAGKARALGGKTDFEIALAGDRAQANADGALERLGRRFLRGRLRFYVRGHGALLLSPSAERGNCQESATLTALSGNSWPKQR